jgi:hypothetical protein
MLAAESASNGEGARGDSKNFNSENKNRNPDCLLIYTRPTTIYQYYQLLQLKLKKNITFTKFKTDQISEIQLYNVYCGNLRNNRLLL